MIVDVESFKVVHVLTDHEVKPGKDPIRVDDVKFSPDSVLLIAGFHNGLITIFLVEPKFEKKGNFRGNSSYITHLDWSKNGRVVQSDSGAYEHLFWDLEDFGMITKSSLVRDTLWDTYTCVLGWHVKGIWPKGSDGTDINASCMYVFFQKRKKFLSLIHFFLKNLDLMIKLLLQQEMILVWSNFFDFLLLPMPNGENLKAIHHM